MSILNPNHEAQCGAVHDETPYILSLALATHDYAGTRTFRSPADPIPPCGSPDVKAVSTYLRNWPPGLLQVLLRIGGGILGIAGRALENPCHNPPSFSESTLVQLGGDGNAHLWHAR